MRYGRLLPLFAILEAILLVASVAVFHSASVTTEDISGIIANSLVSRMSEVRGEALSSGCTQKVHNGT